jgi:hypothetical protein
MFICQNENVDDQELLKIIYDIDDNHPVYILLLLNSNKEGI